MGVKTVFLLCSVILPLIIRGLSTSFNVGGEQMQEDWSTFGFLYGTIPPAPPAVIYASAFGIQEDLASIIDNYTMSSSRIRGDTADELNIFYSF